MFLSQDVGSDKRGPHDDFWYHPVGVSSAAGVRVSPATALSLSTFYACALVIGQTTGVVPVHLYRRLDRGKARATEHPLYRLIHHRPNRWQTSFQWRQMMQWHLVLRYNAYARILHDPRTGMPTELVPMHPDRTRVERVIGPDGVEAFRYRYKPEGKEEVVLTRGEVFHVRGLTSDGIEGFSPLEVQGESIGEAIAAQRYSARKMKNDARPGGVLEWEGHFKTDEDRKEFRKSWQEAQTNMNQGKAAVLERGMTWKDVGVKNTDLQFIELRKLKSYDICAMHRMPPHKVANLERATFSNIEHSGIEFVTDTMLPWFVNWEQELSNQLLTEDEREQYYFEFLADGLLRGDSKARAEYYGKLFGVAALSPNDILELENRNPVEGGDRRFVPANMMPLDRVDDVVDRGPPPPARGAPADGQSDSEREANAARVVRKETSALSRLYRRENFTEAAHGFYAEHARFVADVMAVDAGVAASYCAQRLAQLEAALADKRFISWLAGLEAVGAEELLAAVQAARGEA